MQLQNYEIILTENDPKCSHDFAVTQKYFKVNVSVIIKCT